MIVKDYYKILGIKRTASAEHIKEAYYRLVRKYHPDRVDISLGPDYFNEINEAYQVLGDLDSRLDYCLLLYLQEDIREEAWEKLHAKRKGKVKLRVDDL